jgi:hypothetical protein
MIGSSALSPYFYSFNRFIPLELEFLLVKYAEQE